ERIYLKSAKLSTTFFTLFLCSKSIARSCCLVLGTSGESTSLPRVRQLFSFTNYLFSIFSQYVSIQIITTEDEIISID
ncbi:MAG: hypothetical protein OCC45_10065, partial [Desulfotalea sp.]